MNKKKYKLTEAKRIKLAWILVQAGFDLGVFFICQE